MANFGRILVASALCALAIGAVAAIAAPTASAAPQPGGMSSQQFTEAEGVAPDTRDQDVKDQAVQDGKDQDGKDQVIAG
ncbi:hypothetical protein [Kutzneria kofuensis]|uniref:Uncharacterized protein n=1 Tax=Kutzneria kofuensis TaxID=103725 RepID=A0A7W9NLX2_9PSEU|nr:hypothetical protein [Kutzneria kofuensis]MBB5896753.1 hypothetical protein [Kutzneria kofuensis]